MYQTKQNKKKVTHLFYFIKKSYNKISTLRVRGNSDWRRMENVSGAEGTAWMRRSGRGWEIEVVVVAVAAAGAVLVSCSGGSMMEGEEREREREREMSGGMVL